MISAQHHDDCGLHHRRHRCSHLGAERGDQLLTTMTHSAPSVHFVQLLCNFCAICARVCTHILPPCTHYKIIQNMILPKKNYIWHFQLIAVDQMDVLTLSTFIHCYICSQNLLTTCKNWGRCCIPVSCKCKQGVLHRWVEHTEQGGGDLGNSG